MKAIHILLCFSGFCAVLVANITFPSSLMATELVISKLHGIRQDAEQNTKQLSQNHLPAAKSSSQPSHPIHFQPSPHPLPKDHQEREAGNPAGGNCTINWQQPMPMLTALVPDRSIGLTLLPNPTVFVYVPPIQERSVSSKLVEFTLLDQDETMLYRSTVPLPKTSGIVSFQIPPIADQQGIKQELQLDRNYIWQVSVLCSQDDPGRNPYVMGFIRRTKPTPALQQELQQALPENRAGIYAREGIWYDALADLAEQQQTQPTNQRVKANWTALLQDVKLDHIAQASSSTTPITVPLPLLPVRQDGK